MIVPNDIKSSKTPTRGGNGTWTYNYPQNTIKPAENKINICPRIAKPPLDTSLSIQGIDAQPYGILQWHTIGKMFKHLPKIRIREYLLDLPEDRWLDILMDSYSTMKEKYEEWKKNPKKFKEFANINCNESLVTFMDKMYEELNQTGVFLNHKDTDGKLWYDFVVFVYRHIISYDVLNYYSLPYSGSINFGSKGSDGWAKNTLFEVGYKILSDININRVPMWKYSGQDSDTISFELNLFNDTFSSAVRNCRFIHTIIPHNMWLQYGLFQHNPCVYDIQFEGGLRYFCCSLDIKCENVGTNREPPDNFFESVFSTDSVNYLKDNINNNYTVRKIPDIYKLTFEFKSLLPNNFNQYMMSHYEQDKILESCLTKDRHTTDLPKSVNAITTAIENTVLKQ